MHAVAAVCIVTFDTSAGRFLLKSEKSITGHNIPALSFRLKTTTTQYDMPAVHLSWDDRPTQLSDSDALNCKQASDTVGPVDESLGGADADSRISTTSIVRRKQSSLRSQRKKASKLEAAKTFLTEALASGAMPTRKLKRLAEDADIAGITLRRAAESLHLVKKGRRWRLPRQPVVI
jgi:hypothetical protein